MLEDYYKNYLAILTGKKKPKFKSVNLKQLIKKAKSLLASCELCERKCKVNRLKGQLGFCKVDTKARIFGMHTHYGEEPELIPSATIFFAGCTMLCKYCQNAPESVIPSLGKVTKEKEIAEWIDYQYAIGSKNVNFVGGEPTPYLYNILKILSFCKSDMPVVWNSNGYYSKKTAEILKKFVDVYLIDFRYYNESCAKRLSFVENYPEAVKRNLIEAKKDKKADLLIRILVLPEHINCDAKPILKWIASNLGRNVRINILNQYYPAFESTKIPELTRRLNKKEIQEVLSYAKKLGLKNLVKKEII